MMMTTPDSLMDNDGSLVAAISSSSPTPQQQKQIIQDLTNNSISKPGNSFFLVSNGYKGGPVLPREMISVGVRQELVVEEYPLCLKLIDARDESELTIRLSKKASLHELHERVCSLKRTDTGKVRIWDYFNNRKQALLEDSTKTLEESDLQMNQSILLEVQADGIYEATVDDISMKVLVFVSFLAKPFFLEGLKSSDTVGIVKNRVNDLVFQMPIQEKYFPLHPATREMVSLHGYVFEDDQTLASLSEPCCSNGGIIMHYVRKLDLECTADLEEQLHFLGLTKSARFIEEPHEEDCFMQLWCSEDEDKNEDEDKKEDEDEDEDEKPKPVSIVKRPKTNHGPLPSIDSGGLGINGPFELFNSKNRIITLCKFKFAVSIKTTAHVILLAPNPEIFNDLVFLNSKSEYLVLHVCWDMRSYFFLRTLRTSCPNIPIVAVTDLDPHHLDLLTFLDTPPEDLPACYGWDLMEDSDDEAETVLVNIKWLGLCPNDCEGLHFDDDARPAQPGFEEVIRMLRVNPHLRRKEDWLAALDWLDLYGKSVSFRLGGDFISRKLSKEGWV